MVLVLNVAPLPLTGQGTGAFRNLSKTCFELSSTQVPQFQSKCAGLLYPASLAMLEAGYLWLVATSSPKLRME